jgi:ferredoxin-type protein NapG
MSSDRKVDRRHFFREGLREFLKPLASAIEPMQEALRQFDMLPAEEQPTTTKREPIERPWLRPPGALFPDQSFRDTCSRCGQCVQVCPAQCIKIDSTGMNGYGAPYIEPNVMACVVCDGLKCMHVCPSGALVPIPLGEINMGTAVWNYETCVRSHGESCTICIDMCPVGSVAIELRANMVHVHEDGCVGCGVCQQQCPTEPKSIVVIPRQI